MASFAAIATILFAAVVFGLLLRKRARRPERRLRRSFAALRKNILRDVEPEQRKGARRLLEQSENYLARLIRAQEQQELLRELASAGSALTGASSSFELRESVRMKALVREQLESFFSSLSRIAASVALRNSDALDSLKAFAEEQEEQRLALLELAAMLEQDRPALEQGAESTLSSRAAQLEEAARRRALREEVEAEHS